TTRAGFCSRATWSNTATGSCQRFAASRTRDSLRSPRFRLAMSRRSRPPFRPSCPRWSGWCGRRDRHRDGRGPRGRSAWYTSPMRRARYYDVPALGAAATDHLPPDGTLFAYPDLTLQYDVYVRRRIVEIGPDELQRLLAAPSRDAVILTRRRWAAAQRGTVAAGWHVLESRTVG